MKRPQNFSRNYSKFVRRYTFVFLNIKRGKKQILGQSRSGNFLAIRLLQSNNIQFVVRRNGHHLKDVIFKT